ncbi:hypothetical protein DOL88_11180 [Aggregatibacter aphrophilus]|uniref:Type VI secretion system tip protein VgrG n=1 Tax=Aggregatibacter aphrophilus TaxID=732 RepID=A0ABX9VRE9_AGGAP|nr:hypothetical protein DOL88_11180 [Aggregatibacter aphrophilus]
MPFIAFIERLAAEEGAYYYFEHQADSHLLHFSNDSQTLRDDTFTNPRYNLEQSSLAEGQNVLGEQSAVNSADVLGYGYDDLELQTRSKMYKELSEFYTQEQLKCLEPVLGIKGKSAYDLSLFLSDITVY